MPSSGSHLVKCWKFYADSIGGPWGPPQAARPRTVKIGSVSHQREAHALFRFRLCNRRPLALTPRFRYTVYGISVHSEMPLALPRDPGDGTADIELRQGTAGRFARLLAQSRLIERRAGYHYAHGADGSVYVRWQGVGQFIASAGGDRIWCAAAPESSEASFQVYLLGQALSMALVKRGREPLHGSAVEHEGRAIALLGGSGYGKSTLAASLIAEGGRLLTDDLLLIRANARGMQAQPGPARIKLFADSAQRFLPAAANGVPMNPLTRKQVIPLDAAQRCQGPARLAALYVLAPPEAARLQRRVRIEPLHAREAFLALLRNTFNRLIVDRERLRRQMLETTRLVQTVPMRTLLFPWDATGLTDVRDAILEDSGLFEARAA